MKHKYIDEIKKLEGSPKIVKLFSNKEIEDILDLYNSLPVTTHNKKQNIIKKRWLQNYNKSLDDMYVSKLKEVLGEFKMDNLKSDKGEDFLGLFHESFSPLKLHVDSGFGAKDIIFICPLVLSSLVTGPKILVPTSSPFSSIKTAALLSNLTFDPSSLCMPFFTLTTTA